MRTSVEVDVAYAIVVLVLLAVAVAFTVKECRSERVADEVSLHGASR